MSDCLKTYAIPQWRGRDFQSLHHKPFVDWAALRPDPPRSSQLELQRHIQASQHNHPVFNLLLTLVALVMTAQRLCLFAMSYHCVCLLQFSVMSFVSILYSVPVLVSVSVTITVSLKEYLIAAVGGKSGNWRWEAESGSNCHSLVCRHTS